MSFASYDAIISAVTNGYHQERFFAKSCAGITLAASQISSLWTGSGMPGAGVSGGTALTGRSVSSATAGAMSFTNPASGDLYLTGFSVHPNFSNAGILILYDRVMDIASIDCTTTADQNITTGTLPRYPNGDGIQMFLEVTTTITGGSSPEITITYTDQDGNTGATSGAAVTTATPVARVPHTTLMWLPLASGDSGVRAVTKAKYSGTVHSAGAMTLVLARPITAIPVPAVNSMNERDLVLQIPKLPEIEDDAALAFNFLAATTATGVFHGSVQAVSG